MAGTRTIRTIAPTKRDRASGSTAANRRRGKWNAAVGVSPNTIAAYRDTMRLLLGFAGARLGVELSQLEIGDLDAPLIGAFLDHLEHDRGCSPRTRNSG